LPYSGVRVSRSISIFPGTLKPFNSFNMSQFPPAD
jgi:hypothetical protein